MLSQFGVSELLLLAKDPSWKVRKHAILAFGPVSDMLDSQIVETGIFNSILSNSKVEARARGWMVECSMAGEASVCDRDSGGFSQYKVAQNVSNDHKDGGRIIP